MLHVPAHPGMAVGFEGECPGMAVVPGDEGWLSMGPVIFQQASADMLSRCSQQHGRDPPNLTHAPATLQDLLGVLQHFLAEIC